MYGPIKFKVLLRLILRVSDRKIAGIIGGSFKVAAAVKLAMSLIVGAPRQPPGQRR
jgi:hypothetical protein